MTHPRPRSRAHREELRQWASAAGYLAIFVMPALLVTGAVTDKPWLALGAVVVVFPLLRTVFGGIQGPAPEWGERVATALDKLPLLYPPVFVASSLFSLHTVASGEPSWAHWAWYGLSFWMTCLFATCVVHELIHRRSDAEATLGHLLAGTCGYPWLGPEHLAHHARPGDVVLAEVPGRREGLWAFAYRRLVHIAREQRLAGIGRVGQQSLSIRQLRLRRALLASFAMVGAYALLAGVAGLALFVVVGLGVAVGVQLITYIQHWGLGSDSLGQGVSFGRGWDDDCRFQAWATLNISLHDEHHRHPRLPYYRVSLSAEAPRLPAGYVVLMFVSLVPPLWFKLLTPFLEQWRTQPGAAVSAGHRITCFGMDRASGQAGEQMR